MNTKNFAVRAALTSAVIAAGLLASAGAASAEVPLQPYTSDVNCTWGGDGPLATQNCNNNGGSGSASGSGQAIGQLIGRALFGGN